VKTPSAREGDGVVDDLVQCLRRAISQNLRTGVLTDSPTQHAPGGARGHSGVSQALQRRTSPPGPDLWQCPASCGLSDVASLTRSPRAGGPGCLADSPESEAVSAPCGSRWVCRSRSGDLLHRSSAGRTYGPAPGDSREPPICRVASGPGRQAASSQRSDRAGDGPLRLSEVYPARSVGCSAAFFCPCAQESPTTFSLERRSLIACFPSSSACFLRRLPRTQASAGKPLFPCRAKTQRNQKQSATWAALASDGTLLLFTHFFFLSPTSAFPSSTPAISMRLLRLRCR